MAMKPLVNAFSLLELDAEDDQIPALSTSSKDDATVSYPSPTGKSKKEVNISGDILTGERQKQGQPNAVAEDYKFPLVWIDLEMTGLNVETDRILEIACIITNGNLTKLVEGPDLVIHQSKECLDKMGEWCQSHHAASGLTKKVLRSTISEREAEKQVIQFVKKHVFTDKLHLAGNSVYMDFIFLKKYMPDLAGLFSHVLVDVSSIKTLCDRWYPRVSSPYPLILTEEYGDFEFVLMGAITQPLILMKSFKEDFPIWFCLLNGVVCAKQSESQDRKKAPPKENKHRAMDDIRESIKELKFYKENIFKNSKK